MSIIKGKKLRWKPGKVLKKYFRLCLLLFLFSFFLEMGWMLISNFPQKTVVAQTGTIEKGFWVEAIYLRCETLLTAPAGGYLKTRVASGTLVPEGEVIGWIGESGDTDLSDGTLKLAKKYAILVSETEGLRSDLARLNREIIYRSANLNFTIKNIGNYQDLESQEQEKRRVLRNIQSNQSKIAEIQKKLKQLIPDVSIITTNQPGIFCSQYDEYENKLSPEKLKQLPEEMLSKRFILKSPGRRLDRGGIVGKIIYPFSRMLAIQVNPQKIDLPKLGDEWRIKTRNEWRKVKIVDIISLSKDKMMIGFNDQNPETHFQPERRQKLFMVYHRITGIAIPVQAIFKKKGHPVVRIVKGDDFSETKIRVLDTDGNQAIVDGLQFGTAILSR